MSKADGRYESKWTAEQLAEACRLYDSGLSLTAVAKQMGMGNGTVSRAVDAAGCTKRPTWRKKLSCREDAFSVVTEESAYWAGFLMADGSVTPPKERVTRAVSIQLKADDSGHLQKFADWLNSDAKVAVSTRVGGYNRKEKNDTRIFSYASVQVSCNRLVEDLETLGIVPRKTYCAVASPLVAMNRDFWRGCMDGDGCIMVWQNEASSGKRIIRPKLKLAGTRALMEQFIAFARMVLPEECKLSIYDKNEGNVCTVGIAGKHAIEMTRHLYADCTIALDRKQDRALEMLCLNFGADKRALQKNVNAPEGHAWCGKCLAYKPLKDCVKSKNRSGGLSGLCKECSRKKGKAMTAEARERKNKKRMERYFEQKAELRQAT